MHSSSPVDETLEYMNIGFLLYDKGELKEMNDQACMWFQTEYSLSHRNFRHYFNGDNKKLDLYNIVNDFIKENKYRITHHLSFTESNKFSSVKIKRSSDCSFDDQKLNKTINTFDSPLLETLDAND